MVPSFKKLSQNELNSIETWLNNASKYFDSAKRTGYWFVAKNHMMYDFGFDPMMENDNQTRAAIEAIDKTFHFIMISNYMDESLVLLADMLCWPLEDVSSVVLNHRDAPKQNKLRIKKVREKAREWKKADTALFDFFNKSLWNRIEKFGFQRMKMEVKKLQSINQKLSNQCIDSKGKKLYKELKNTPWVNMTIFEPKGIKISGFDLKPGAELNNTCVNLIAPEPYLNKIVLEVQKNKHLLNKRKGLPPNLQHEQKQIQPHKQEQPRKLRLACTKLNAII